MGARFDVIVGGGCSLVVTVIRTSSVPAHGI